MRFASNPLRVAAASLVGCAGPSASDSQVLDSRVQAAVETFSPLIPNDPYFVDQWTLHNEGPTNTADGRGEIAGSDHAHVADAWGLIMALGLADRIEDIGKDVRLAILDDGFDLAHEELAGRVVASRNFGDAVEPGNLFSNASGAYNFHGMRACSFALPTFVRRVLSLARHASLARALQPFQGGSRACVCSLCVMSHPFVAESE